MWFKRACNVVGENAHFFQGEYGKQIQCSKGCSISWFATCFIFEPLNLEPIDKQMIRVCSRLLHATRLWRLYILHRLWWYYFYWITILVRNNRKFVDKHWHIVVKIPMSITQVLCREQLMMYVQSTNCYIFITDSDINNFIMNK